MSFYWDLEKSGAVSIAEVAENCSYEHDLIAAFRSKDGDIFYGHTSGCSCYGPFDDYDKVEQLDEVTRHTYKDIAEDARSHGYNPVEVAEFLRAVRDALRAQARWRRERSA